MKNTRNNNSKRGPFALLLAASVCIAALAALGASASAAHGAYSFSIGVSGPPKATVGSPVSLRVSGVNPPPGEYWFNSYFSVEALPVSVFSACPAGHGEGSQAAVESTNAGGLHVTPIWVRERPDPSGAWSASLAYAPRAAGRMLLCAYTNDGFSNTLAEASTSIDVSRAGARAKKACKRKRHAKKCRKRR